jgi:hypothetical protein
MHLLDKKTVLMASIKERSIPSAYYIYFSTFLILSTMLHFTTAV